MKRVLVISLSLVLLVVLLGGWSLFKKKSPKQGKVLTIYAWNTEFQDRFKKYFEDAGKLPEGVKVNWVITPNQGNAYQQKLDEALLNQKNVAADNKIDIFLVEADYALKYVDTDYTLDVVKDIGLSKSDLTNMYKPA